jgi:branched-chain amino acid transport system substrate-binding protein
MKQPRILVGLAATSIALSACGGTSTGGPAAAGCTKLNSISLAGALHTTALVRSSQSKASQEVVRARTAANTVLKIGYVGPLAGKYQQYGIDEKNGVQLAIDEANTAGVSANGVSYTLKLDPKDDNGLDAQLGVTAAQQLVDDHVVAVIGDAFSTPTIAASTIYHDHGIVQISPSATNPKYTSQGFNTAFRVVGRDDQQGPADADFIIKTLGCKNVAVMDDKSTYGQGLADAVAGRVPTDGGTVVDREHIDATSSDFKAQLTTVKGKTPDIIFYGGYSPQAGPLTKQAHDLGLTVPVIGGDGMQDDQYISLAATAANGNFASNAGPAHNLMNGYDAFSAKYKAKFGQDVFQYAPQAYDATNIVIAAIKASGSDTAKILAAVAATKDFQGVAQSYSFNSTGDVTNSIFTIYEVKNGKFAPVKAVTVSA